MGMARVRISHELLATVMGWPEGTKIRGCTTSNDNSVGLILDHEDIKGTFDKLPLIHPTYTRVDFGWGQE